MTKYISFSPYYSGLANVIMSYEMLFAAAYLTKRKVILPPDVWLLFISESHDKKDYIDNLSMLVATGDVQIYDLKIKKIPVGGGFHNWHYENGSISDSPRAFVMQLYLNDDFEGGETEFLYQNRRELAVAGDVIMFPAGFTHTHRGNPPIGGTKYIVTSWGITQRL